MVYAWLNYLLLPVINICISLERKLVEILDKRYANKTVSAYTINRIRGFKGHHIYYIDKCRWEHLDYKSLTEYDYLIADVTYNPTSMNYQVPIIELEQLRFIKTQQAVITEPKYRFLKRSTPSTLNMIRDHRQIISATCITGLETVDADIDLIHSLAGPNGDFFAELPGDRQLLCKAMRQYIAFELGIGYINQLECFISTGDNIII